MPDDGVFPGNPSLPLLLYAAVWPVCGPDLAADIEACFRHNGWGGTWRNGVYGFHHYHSAAHEVLGVSGGWGRVQFGGPQGSVLKLQAGDAALLPAGTAHRLVEASADFAVVGAYPPGQRPRPVPRKGGGTPRGRPPHCRRGGSVGRSGVRRHGRVARPVARLRAGRRAGTACVRRGEDPPPRSGGGTGGELRARSAGASFVAGTLWRATRAGTASVRRRETTTTSAIEAPWACLLRCGVWLSGAAAGR
jgi:uncharacterized protein YjlB